MKFQKIAFLPWYLFVLGIMLTVPAIAQDDNKNIRIFEIDDFSELFLEGAFGVELIQGNKTSLEVRVSDPKAYKYLNITNEGELLHLHVDRKPFDFSRITLHVTFETLRRLRVFGSIKLETRGYLDLTHLDVLLEGGARVNLLVKANKVSVENRGGVLVELSGVTDILNVRLAGTGHIDAGGLKSRDVEFRIDGVGTGKVFATHNLNATIKGAGKIRYLGNPHVTESIDGLGSISPQ